MRKKLLLSAAAVLTASLLNFGSAEAATQTYVETNKGWVSYKAQPSSSSQTLGRLELGERAVLVSKYNNYWYKVRIDGKTVYITTNSKYTHLEKGAATAPAQQPKATPKPVSQPQNGVQAPQTVSAKQAALMRSAKSQIGVDYKWGTMKPGVGFDCSNFTSWVYRDALGITFSSSSRKQRYDDSIGRPVSLPSGNKFANLQVGDLLFFANSKDSGGGAHVGMYAGEIGGKHYIIQQGGGRGKVTYEPMEGTWFASKLVYAKRIL